MDVKAQATLATQFRALHKPGDPIILANVYDASTASIIASLYPETAHAMATASYAVAAVQGINDDDMTYEQNISSIKNIAKVAVKHNIPLTVDVQDGYSDVADTVTTVIKLGAVGCNIEDVDNTTGNLRSVDDAASRIKTAVEAAGNAGVPDFAINARTDVLGSDGTIADAIERGRRYLDAGANTVFVWGGSKGRGVRTEEVRELVKGLDGRLNVILKLGDGFLTVKELKEIGVARISVGPALWAKAMAAFRENAEALLKQ